MCSTVVHPMQSTPSRLPAGVFNCVFTSPYICMRTATESISYSFGTGRKTAVTYWKVLVWPEHAAAVVSNDDKERL